MERTIVNISIEQVANDSETCEIRVSASRNGQPQFSEEFKSTDKPLGVHLYHSRDIEANDTEHSASLASISALANTISRSVKTEGKVISEDDDNLWRAKHIIREFEKLANVRFDYSHFKTIREFQQYFKHLKEND